MEIFQYLRPISIPILIDPILEYIIDQPIDIGIHLTNGCLINIYLVGGWPTPLKNDGVSSSVGMMTFPTEWKSQIHVPNHQPDIMG